VSELARKRQRANLEPSKAYAARRKILITGAAEVFRAKGLSDTTLHDIGASIGVDRATLYYYFGSKEQLFRAVILESIGNVLQRAEEICAGPGCARGRLAALMNHVVCSFEEHYPSLHIFVQEDMRRLESSSEATSQEARRLAELADVYMAMLEDLIREGVDGGEFRNLHDPSHVAQIIQGGVNWMHRWFNPSEEVSAAELAQVFVSILLDGLAFSSRGETAPVDDMVDPVTDLGC
jgi:AcrR family transcriptional regulator